MSQHFNLQPVSLMLILFAAATLMAASAQGRPGIHAAYRQSKAISEALKHAGANRSEIERALNEAPPNQREAMQFLVENMPERDLRSLSAKYLLENVQLAFTGFERAPWHTRVPKDMFLNDILPYACLNETRDDSRRFLAEKCAAIVADCETPAEAAQRINRKLFSLLKTHYSTDRRRPDQSPLESIEQGRATCSGLSILLVDACRTVGIPARVVGTPMWTNLRGNHTWVEIWDGEWHFTGADEPDPAGLDRGWFVGDAAKAKADAPQHAIYASSFRRTDTAFPLVWAPEIKWVPAVNVTARYAAPDSLAASGKSSLLVRVVDSKGKRIRAKVLVSLAGSADAPVQGESRDERADLNDILSFPVLRVCPPQTYQIRVEYRGRISVQQVKAGGTAEQVITVKL